MLIANVRIALSPTRSARRHVEIRGERVFLRKDLPPGDAVDLSGHLLLPGLINAHDHLEFNLFPRLGRRIYANASEWAADIHRPDELPVREHLAVDKGTRLIWGGLRNLLSGVTMVAHHNPYEADVFDDNFPVRVVRHFGWAHSMAFSPDAAARYRETPADQPFIIHAGEGTDARARAEIAELDAMGILSNRTVIVHGLAFDHDALALLRSRGASLVWCPSSNLLTYGETLGGDRLHAGVSVALGTDSAISAAGDMSDELCVARTNCGMTSESLYRMVTSDAANILRLNASAGALFNGAVADLVAVADRGQTPAEALIDLAPELVAVRGRVHLVSETLAGRFASEMLAGFHPIALEGRGRWRTPFDVARLLDDARAALGPEVRLAGKLVQQ